MRLFDDVLQLPEDTTNKMTLLNISDDFRAVWTLNSTANVTNSSVAKERTNRRFKFAGHALEKEGVAYLRLIQHKGPHESLFSMSGELSLRNGKYSNDVTDSWSLQGLYFPASSIVVALAVPLNNMSSLENVEMILPDAKDVTPAAVLSMLTRLSPGKEEKPTNATIASLSRRPTAAVGPKSVGLCTFVMALKLSTQFEFAEPYYKREKSTEKILGVGSPFIQIRRAVLHSPNCEALTHVELVKGKSMYLEATHKKARTFGVIVMVLCFAQAVGLFGQLRVAESSLRAGRMSGIAMAMLLLLDAYAVILLFLTGWVVPGCFMLFLLLGTLQFFLFSFFEVRLFAFVLGPNLPHVIQFRGTYFRWYFAMLFIVSLTFHLPSLYWFALMILAYSFWVPQIIENARKNNRGTLEWTFIVTSSLGRLVPVLYFLMLEENFLQLAPRFGLGVALIVWMLIQLFALWIQDRFGARSFLPFLVEPSFNYKPDIRERGLLENCVICMSPITEDEVDRRSYMVPPCGHVFHEACLMTWMETKMQCPICRAEMPQF